MSLEIKYNDPSLFKLPASHDLILFLVQKELQGTRFTNELCKLGFDASAYSPDLGVVVLSLMGVTERTDAHWEWYYQTLDALAEKVDLQDQQTAQTLAMEFYWKLKTYLEESK